MEVPTKALFINDVESKGMDGQPKIQNLGEIRQAGVWSHFKIL